MKLDCREQMPSLGAQHDDLRYAWWVVTALMAVYIISLLDRQVMTLLIQPMRRDLSLSDTEISLLAGFAFAVSFTVTGLPVAWLADWWSRRNIIVIGMTIWSLATIASGLAQSFWMLFLARIFVGIGESALAPSAYSMIADYFPPDKRGRATSVFVLGLYLGTGVAMLIGSTVVGILSDVHTTTIPILGTIRSWQITFLVAGIPGIIAAAVFYCTVREPPRTGLHMATDTMSQPDAGSMPARQTASIAEFIKFLRLNLFTLSMVFMAFASAGICLLGLLTWVPEFLRRTYDFPIAEAGALYGGLLLVLGGSGALFGGWLCDLLLRRGTVDASLRISFVAFLATAIGVVSMSLTESKPVAIASLAFTTFFIAIPQALSPVAIHSITPGHFRAQIIATYLFIANLIAIGLGPTLFAIVTDLVFNNDSSLRFSIAIVAGTAMAASLLLTGLALRPFRLSHARTSAGVTP